MTLRVNQRTTVNKQWGRRRAGFTFGKEPKEVTREMLGDGLAGVITLVMICEDPLLRTVFIGADGEEREVGEAELAELRTMIEAEGARVTPADPPVDMGGFNAADAAHTASADAPAASNNPAEDSQTAGAEPAAPAADAPAASDTSAAAQVEAAAPIAGEPEGKPAKPSGRKPRG